MRTDPQEIRDRFFEYRTHVEQDLLGPALRNAILIFILLQTLVFIPADWVLFPDAFWPFLVFRLVLNALLIAMYLGTALRYPVGSSVVVCVAGGAMFLAMVDKTGGSESGYYAGLILLVVGMGILTPQSSRQAGLISALVFSGYALLPLYTGSHLDWRLFALHLFFLGAACVEAWWASRYMESMRFADYCQQRELEEARDELAKLDQAKSRFSANVHHELRTPLTLILAPLDALRTGDMGQLSSLVQNTLATMHANGRRLHKMINNLLDLSKMENHEFRIVRQQVNLRTIVEELIVGARGLAERKGIDISMNGFDELPDVYVDPDALEKVLVNLVGNALKFTDSGGRIAVIGESEVGGVSILVVDSGIGISQKQIDSVFDRFAQVDSSATRNYEGTGIGLSLAREIVELHGGKIWADSEGEGRGTTLHVMLPLGEPDAHITESVLRDDDGVAHDVGASIAAVEADLNIEDRPARVAGLLDMERSVRLWEDVRNTAATGLTRSGDLVGVPEVLIAEDNPDMRELLAMIVGKEYLVRLTKNGREALDAIKDCPPDLVLSDVMMPEMSGTELCAAVKGDPNLRHIPVVLVTSKAEREMKIEGLEIGADDYVTKPFHPRELMARVRSLVKLRQAGKELDRQNALLESANTELRTALAELHEAEVQLVKSERLAAVGELVAGVAHEINNPMNYAINALRTMGDYLGDVSEVTNAYAGINWGEPAVVEERMREIEKLREARDFDEATAAMSELFGIVTEGLDRTQRLVENLQDFAAPGEATVSDVDIASGLKTTVQLIGHATRDANVEVRLDIAEPLPAVEGDRRALNQVFLNLLKNATEVLAGKGGEVEVSARARDGEVVVEIRDDGPGIAPEELLRVFEPFYTTKAAGRGTGLGLSISRRIVDEHGGEIEVSSETGHGATFRVTLPCREECSAA